MSESKDFLQKAGLISVATLLRDLMEEMNEVKSKYDQILSKLTTTNILDYEGQIYSLCICSDKTKLDKLKQLFDQYRALLNFEKPAIKYQTNLFREIIRQINHVRLDFINESYAELRNTQREVVKHLRVIDTTIANAEKKKKKEEDLLNDEK